MCKKYICIQLLGLFVLLSGCSDKSGNYPGELDGLEVKWELLSNFVGDSDEFDAQFTFVNNSDIYFGNSGWALFFSMSPRPVLETDVPQPATIEHINGDWYVMRPNEGFELGPGMSLNVLYRGTEGVIKETDAPMGLYIVFYGENGEEENILQISNWEVLPFEREEQLLRGIEDKEVPISSEKRYRENLGLEVISPDDLHPIIPSPVSLKKTGGTLNMKNLTGIYYEKGLDNEAVHLQDKLKEFTGMGYAVYEGEADDLAIVLRKKTVRVNETEKEAYNLNISAQGINITGTDEAGVFYGVQSLLALLGPEVFLGKNKIPVLEHVSIEDAPRFPFRSLHMDVSRNFQTKETVMRTLDLLSHYKINHFLFYTTEDEGWRLEIEGLPELTEIGAKREHTGGKDTPVVHPAYGSGPFAYEEGKHGSGYYTKADFIEILEYARARHITVIPELNFPGHARAAIKSMEARYNRLMEEGKEEEANEYRLIDPEDESVYLSAQAFKDNVVNVAQESTYRFYEKVVDEIAGMYRQAGLTMKIIHAGGDEVAEGAWTASPMAKVLTESLQKKSAGNEKELGYPATGKSDVTGKDAGFDPKNLQTHFFRELLKRLEKRNLEVHVWEEMALMKTTDGAYVPNPEFVGRNVVPYIWNNMFDYPDLGYQLANMGYEVVLCNVSNFYFDLAYDNDPKEPGLYWAGFVNTRNAWTFAPFDWFKTTYKTSMGEVIDQEKEFRDMVRIKPEARKNIRGLEAQLWSETIKGRDMIEYYMLPKLFGYAESAWATERTWENEPDRSKRDNQIAHGWNSFANTIAQREFPKLSAWNGGYNYRLAPPGAILENGRLFANVDMPGLIIRYTMDGTEPNNNSPIYKESVEVNGKVVNLKSFDARGNFSRTSSVRADG